MPDVGSPGCKHCDGFDDDGDQFLKRIHEKTIKFGE